MFCSPVQSIVDQRQVVCDGDVNEPICIINHIKDGINVPNSVLGTEDIRRILVDTRNSSTTSLMSNRIRSYVISWSISATNRNNRFLLTSA